MTNFSNGFKKSGVHFHEWTPDQRAINPATKKNKD